jgi:hypothetical protein
VEEIPIKTGARYEERGINKQEGGKEEGSGLNIQHKGRTQGKRREGFGVRLAILQFTEFRGHI